MRSQRYKSSSLAFVTVILATAIVGAIESLGNSFEIASHTIDGGGGDSAGGAFVLVGTIGQPDASGVIMSGGSFELRGGFWSGGVEPVKPCPADIAPARTGDGLVGVPDLLAVINGWGPCPIPPADCPADISPAGPPIGDGTVGVPDLLRIINSWGVCP